MNVLCGYHAKDPEVCKWVIDNCDPNTNNIAERLWLEASKQQLLELGIEYDRMKQIEQCLGRRFDSAQVHH